MEIALFFLPPSLGGGSTSYTVHLYKSLQIAGYNPTILRIRPRGEDNLRKFAKYEGVFYRNVTAEQALAIAADHASILTAPAHSKHLQHAPDIIHKLCKFGMWIVTHDPNEFKVYDHLAGVHGQEHRMICIRPTMKKYFPMATYIPHPYVRQFPQIGYRKQVRPMNAASVARISFVKRSHIILEANALLPNEHQCVLLGAENRMYTRFNLQKKFPNFKQGGYGFPMTWGASAIQLSRATFAVDMTYFPNDGGGSQYSFMEAWDAGTVNIIHEDWLRYPGEMRSKFRCVSVNGSASLAAVLAHTDKYDLEEYVNAGYKALKAHAPKVIGKAYGDLVL